MGPEIFGKLSPFYIHRKCVNGPVHEVFLLTRRWSYWLESSESLKFTIVVLTNAQRPHKASWQNMHYIGQWIQFQRTLHASGSTRVRSLSFSFSFVQMSCRLSRPTMIWYSRRQTEYSLVVMNVTVNNDSTINSEDINYTWSLLSLW